MVSRVVAIIAVSLLCALSAWLGSTPAGMASSDYPAPDSLHLPLIHNAPTPTPTATPIPIPPCSEARPRNIHAERIVLYPGDFPSSYGMVLGEVVDFGPLDDVVHSEVAVLLDSTRIFVGPAVVGTRAVVFCTEQGAQGAWPAIVRFIDDTMGSEGESQRVDIPVGDQRYALKARSGFYIGYGAAFRKENVIAIAIIAGIDGFLTQDHVHEVMRRMRNKSD